MTVWFVSRHPGALVWGEVVEAEAQHVPERG